MEDFNFKINFIYAIELSGNSYVQTFKTLDEAKTALEAIALYTLYLHDEQVMHDYSNVAFIEEYVDGEWEEVADKDDV